MAYKVYGALVASLGAIALLFAAGETIARPATAHGAGFAPTHSISRPHLAQSLRHRGRNRVGAFWPGVGGFYDGPDGAPMVDATPPASGDVHYTYTQDVPWDWAHRYPPAVAPSDRPYVSSCPAESVTVPGRDGKDQVINITRCY
jgi:hypothetical protein